MYRFGLHKKAWLDRFKVVYRDLSDPAAFHMCLHQDQVPDGHALMNMTLMAMEISMPHGPALAGLYVCSLTETIQKWEITRQTWGTNLCYNPTGTTTGTHG